MKSINIISSLICSLFVFSGQQANANTYFSNKSNSTASGLSYVQTDVVKLAKQPPKVEEPKIVVKEEPKNLFKEEPKNEVKEEPKIVVKEEAKNEVKDEVKIEVKEEPKNEVKEEPKKEVKEEPKKEVKEEPKNEVKEEPKNEVKDEVKNEAKNEDKKDSDDGTNPLSFENLVSNDHSDNNHCKSKKGNECNEGDNHDEDSHHNGDDDDEDEHEISPVPIPGAIWLFGTALMGFISMSSRRKV